MADLITVAQAKDFAEINGSENDAIIETIIGQISTRIRMIIGRDIDQQTYTEYYNHKGRNNELYLRNWPLISITSLHEDLNRDFDANSEIDVSEDVFTDDEKGIIYLNARDWRKGKQHIKVVYDGGYASVPEDLELACQYWVRVVYEWEREKKFGKSNINLPGGQSLNLTFDTPPAFVMNVLKDYKERI